VAYVQIMLDYLSEQIMSLKMARNEKYRNVLKTAYSKWHRRQHNGIAFTDIDKIAQCPACAKALFIGDLIFNKDDSYKTKVFFTKSVYLEISRALNIPYFEIYYTTVARADDGDLERLSVRRIHPNKADLKHVSLDQWLQYLEFKVLEHSKVCQRRDYLLQRVTEENEHNKNFVRKNNYVKILSIRS
jgi:hypothetical protein